MVSLSLQPTAHPSVFQHATVRTSIPCYRNFILAMGSSPGFGSTANDSARISHSLSLRLRPVKGLTLPPTVTHGLIMQKACGHPDRSQDHHSLLAHSFRYYFTPLAGVLFTFPSRYWFTIGHQRVFSLGRWASRIQTGFHVSRPTWDTAKACSDFVYGPITLYGRTFQNFPLSSQVPCRGPATPPRKRDGLGCSPFARHYLGNLN